jgi:hypothetical protein
MSAKNPDGHCYVVGHDGLIRTISPLFTRDWRDDHAQGNDENLRARQTAVDASRERWLEATKDTPAGVAHTASQVVRDDPKRGLRIGRTGVWLVAMPLASEMKVRGLRAEMRLYKAKFDDYTQQLRLHRADGKAQREEAMKLERVARKEQLSVYPTWDGVQGPAIDHNKEWDVYAEMGEVLGIEPSYKSLTARAASLRRQGHADAAAEFDTWAAATLKANGLRRKIRNAASCRDAVHKELAELGGSVGDPDDEHAVVLLDGRGSAVQVEDGAALIRQAFRETGGVCPVVSWGASRQPWSWSGDAKDAEGDFTAEGVAMIGWIDVITRRGGGARSAEVTAAIAAVRTLGDDHQRLFERISGMVPESANGAAGEAAGPAAAVSAEGVTE